MDGKELMIWAFVLILVVVAIAVPVGIHLSNNNKKSDPTNTPDPGGTGPPVPPIVTPQSGQPPIAPPIAPRSGEAPIVPPPVVTPKKYKYEKRDIDNDLVWGCPLKDGIWNSVSTSASELKGQGRLLLERECSERDDCVGYYEAPSWLISTDKLPEECDDKPNPSQKYPYFYLKKEKES